MFQRQVMFKQLQELQRRQQLQELGDPRNQNYLNQLSSLKQSGGQFPPTINGTPVHDSSQMFMLGNNMQMMPNELVLSQPQFDPSLYGNMDKNLDQYSYYQRPCDSSGNMLSKNSNTSPFGMSYNMLDGPSVANQVFQEKNFFGQVPFQGFDGGNLSEPAAPLDPMEQKILYDTDGNNWESSFNQSSKTGGDALPSIESGSWSALMQSALAETSSEDNGVQEEWSGLSFQNPDNQPFNFLDNEKPQSNWVDRNSQNLSSKSEQLFENSNMATIFQGFPQSGYQNFKPKDESHHEVSQVSPQLSHRNTGQSSNYNSQLRQSSPSPRIWPGHESGGNSWLNESQLHGGMQKPFDQANQVNVINFSSKSDKMDSGNNVESMSPFVGGSLDFDGQNMATQSVSMLELLNKDDDISNDDTPGLQLNSKVSTFDELSLTENSVASLTKPSSNSVSQGFGFTLGPVVPQTQQSHSFFPSMGPVPPVQSLVSKLLDNSPTKTTNSSGQEFSTFENVPITQPSASALTQHVGLQQDMSSHKPNMFSSNSSSPDTNSGAPGEQPNQGSSLQEGLTETYNNQSQISLQMAPSWFKQYGMMNNPKSANNVAQLLNSGMITGNLQDISSIMQVNSAIQPAASIILASKHIPINENLVIPKKRKRVDFEMLPWRKEVNGETLGIQSTGLVETEWARSSNRKEEVISDAENVKDKVPPGVQAKRRLTFTTELIQQVFQPPPAVLLSADASLNFDSVAYYVSRLGLGDVCSLTSRLPHQTRDFSKVVEDLESRMKKLEEDLARADNSGLSFVDFKLENHELEKISTINRFAKYHIKTNVDPASSSTSSASNVPRNSPEKYVIALPMPSIVPEGVKCLSL